MIRRPPRSTLFPTRRSSDLRWQHVAPGTQVVGERGTLEILSQLQGFEIPAKDRKSTRLNSSHGYISYAVFCLKKKKTQMNIRHRKVRRDHKYDMGDWQLDCN